MFVAYAAARTRFEGAPLAPVTPRGGRVGRSGAGARTIIRSKQRLPLVRHPTPQSFRGQSRVERCHSRLTGFAYQRGHFRPPHPEAWLRTSVMIPAGSSRLAPSPTPDPFRWGGEMGEKSSLASGRRRPCNLKRRLAGLRVVADREDRHPHGLPHSAWAMPAFIAKTRSSLSLIWPTCPPETPFGWQIAVGGLPSGNAPLFSPHSSPNAGFALTWPWALPAPGGPSFLRTPDQDRAPDHSVPRFQNWHRNLENRPKIRCCSL